ncbi:MAG: hypothetical protein CIT03_03125 [Methanobacterium sp.]|nr:MAG: hypothetical protein CIT03_03125 [Methanobacterium sp.]
MKVLNVVMQNYLGGPQIRVISVAEKLKKEGVNTILACPSSSSGNTNFTSYAQGEGFPVNEIFFPGPSNFNSVKSILKNIFWIVTIPLTVFQFTRLIRRENVDLVHVNGVLNFQPALAAYLSRRKVVWHLMSSLYPSFLISLMMILVKPVAEEIIVIAPSLGEYYLGEGFKSRSNVQVIYEPVDPDKFNLNQALFKKEHLLTELGLNNSHFIGVCVANINPVKGHRYLIEALPLVLENNPNFKLLLVGDVPSTQKEYYLQLVELLGKLNLTDSIYFLGSREDIPSILGISNLLILPSIAEGTPLVILEAMCMGKAVIATDVGAIKEQMIDHKTGFIIPPQDPVALSESIIRLMEDETLRKKMGENGLKEVQKFYLDKCVRAHLETYKKALNINYEI